MFLKLSYNVHVSYDGLKVCVFAGRRVVTGVRRERRQRRGVAATDVALAIALAAAAAAAARAAVRHNKTG